DSLQFMLFFLAQSFNLFFFLLNALFLIQKSALALIKVFQLAFQRFHLLANSVFLLGQFATAFPEVGLGRGAGLISFIAGFLDNILGLDARFGDSARSLALGDFDLARNISAACDDNSKTAYDKSDEKSEEKT